MKVLVALLKRYIWQVISFIAITVFLARSCSAVNRMAFKLVASSIPTIIPQVEYRTELKVDFIPLLLQNGEVRARGDVLISSPTSIGVSLRNLEAKARVVYKPKSCVRTQQGLVCSEVGERSVEVQEPAIIATITGKAGRRPILPTTITEQHDWTAPSIKVDGYEKVCLAGYGFENCAQLRPTDSVAISIRFYTSGTVQLQEAVEICEQTGKCRKFSYPVFYSGLFTATLTYPLSAP